MVLPDKYISIEQSLIGLAALVLDVIGQDEIAIENLWTKFSEKYFENSKTKLSHQPSFQKFMMTLNFMYATDMIACDTEKGVLFNENFKPDDI